MAKGKWSHLKGKVDAFQQPTDFQQQVNEFKEQIRLGGRFNDKIFLSSEFNRFRVEKDRLESAVRETNVALEAVQQFLLERMEEEEITQFRLEDGALIYLQDNPYVATEDKAALLAWIKKNKMEEILSVNYQTLSGITKDALMSGGKLPMPAGVKVFMKTLVRYKKG